MVKKNTGIGIAILFALSGFMLLSGCDQHQKEKDNMDRLAIVNVQWIMDNSAPSEQGKQHLAQVTENLNKGIKQIEAVYGASGSHPTESVLKQGLQRITLQQAAEKAHARKVVYEAMRQAVTAWLHENPGTIIIPGENVLAADPTLDITTNIIDKMEGLKLDFGPPPTVNVTPPEPSTEKSQPGTKDKVH